MRVRATTALWMLVPLVPAAHAQEDWLPPAGAEAVVQQLVERMKPIDLGQAVPEEMLRETARKSVSALQARLASWGEKTVREHAPALASLDLPRAGQPHLDAMARYFTCAGAYEVLHLRGRFAKADTNARLFAAMAPTSLSMASLYLRHHYLAAGGTDARMEAFLSGPSMEPAFGRIQDSEPLLESVHQQCRPLVTWLIHE